MNSPIRSGSPTPSSITASTTSIRPAGPRSLLLEFESLNEVLACHQQLTSSPLPGQIDAVPAARTILLSMTTRGHARAALDLFDTLELGSFSTEAGQEVEIEVVYDGADLEDLAAQLDLSPEALVNWHAGQPWTGAFGGFAPGFTYCVPRESQRSIPRRETPRTKVPVGAVAVAGEFSSVYPRASPGGWQLIGHTQQKMWDLSRETPALVRPGDTVYYRSVREQITASQKEDSQESASEESAAQETRSEATPSPEAPPHGVEQAALKVISAGLHTLIQDFGRPGFSNLGVGRAGVADGAAAHQANRLVGNSTEAPVLEILNGGLQLLAEQTTVLAVTGAEIPLRVTTEDGSVRTPPSRSAIALLAGEQLSLEHPTRGIRSILAVRGGISATPVLSSVSTDTMSGLGPAPLEAGDHIHRADYARHPVGEPEPSTLPTPDEDDAVHLRFTYGPRQDWFTAEEAWRLTQQPWSVSQDSNRIGLRLDTVAEDPTAGALERSRHDELPSEGVARGSLQMPPQGTPVLFLNDRPVTGGYPVLGVLVEEDISFAAQLGPGNRIRLTAVDPHTLKPLESAEQISTTL